MSAMTPAAAPATPLRRAMRPCHDAPVGRGLAGIQAPLTEGSRPWARNGRRRKRSPHAWPRCEDGSVTGTGSPARSFSTLAR
ncbi:hypothetical protein B9S64_08780 [Streptomyces sp. SM18]|nr:hypothetical protein B9S64_08780 [Streptomyces sp. SM18]